LSKQPRSLRDQAISDATVAFDYIKDMPAELTASQDARLRYSKAFSSSIFDPAPLPQERPAPAGKRRDQTTSEMFGSYDEKDLRGMPKTFMPKDDPYTARQKKLNHLSSGVLPASNYPPAEEVRGRLLGPRMEGVLLPDGEEDDVDTNLRRQVELSSKLFGRQTPAVTVEQVHDPDRKLMPNDFTWNSHPEAAMGGDIAANAAERAFQQKCSKVFDHTTPNTMGHHQQATKIAKEEERAGEQTRRANPHYSDLFGRSAYEPQVEAGAAGWRPRSRRSAEDKIAVHQDWTDSRTELLNGPNEAKAGTPAMRKSQELHGSSRIFGNDILQRQAEPTSGQPDGGNGRLEPLSYDNSMKLKKAIGLTPQEIHQAHQRSSVVSDEIYHQAQNAKHWQVAELFLSGLPRNGDEKMVRNLCQGFDLQLVRVTIDSDPVSYLCKGRAKIMVRYNPMRDPIEALARQLEQAGLRVEM
jgi:hypothetical protein